METNQMNSLYKEPYKDNSLRAIKPDFNFDNINAEDIKNDVEKHLQSFELIQHKEILAQLLQQIQRIDFRELAGFTDEDEKLSRKHYLVCCIEQILNIVQQNNWGMCKNHVFVYLYNGAYWSLFENEILQDFLSEAAEKMGIDKFDARHYLFREQLYKQFLAVANLPKPKQLNDEVFINLKNGTHTVSLNKQQLRPQEKKRFYYLSVTV